ncbi:MAG: metal ABC transporter permease [Candidatus Sumerlaeia bacterium]|nr:metal ABC transporter permease [Candidatus Sumerlaeia bacterium]
MILWWQASALIGGASAGLLGVYLVGLRMPFLSVGMAHAAMAGAVFAHLLGWPMGPVAMLAALGAALGMGWLTSRCARSDLNTITSILLSFTMGLAFLGIGLNRGEMSPLLSLMWGSLLFVRPKDLLIMGALAVVLGLFVAVFHRRLDAVLFSRNLARVCGIPESVLLSLFLLLAAAIITTNLQIVGGLMMYSLLTNPAAAAYEVGTTMGRVRAVGLLTGVLSTLGGFWLSYGFNLPTGACIVLISTALYGLAILIGRQLADPQR